MSGPNASYPRKIQIAPDSTGVAGTYADLETQTKIDFDEKADNVDISQLNSAGYHQRLTTLLDSGISLEYLYDSAATAQGTIRSAKSGRTQLWVKLFLTASTGVIVPMVVDDIKTSLDPAGVTKQSVSLSGNGAITTF